MLGRGALASKSSGLFSTCCTMQVHTLSSPRYTNRTTLSWNTKFPGNFNSRRCASTSPGIIGEAMPLATRVRKLLLGTAIAASLVFGYLYVTDTRAGVHRWIVVPALRWIYDDAEDAHEAGTKALKTLYIFGLHPRERSRPDIDKGLEVEVNDILYPCKCTAQD